MAEYQAKEARREFEAEVDRGCLHLDRIALLIAAEEYGALDVDGYLAQLDELAADFRDQQLSHGDVLADCEALSEFLFRSGKFTGNSASYYDPRNSFLNEVLDTGKGIPITLSLVLMETGRRLGLPLRGVALPGHFIVSATDCGESLLLDPFNKGKVITEADCARIVGDLTGGSFDRAMLGEVSNGQIVTRMLQNLKGIYFKSSELDRALRVIERLRIIQPNAVGELRDQGLVCFSLKRFGQAVGILESYLRQVPDAVDGEKIRKVINEARQRHSLLN